MRVTPRGKPGPPEVEERTKTGLHCLKVPTPVGWVLSTVPSLSTVSTGTLCFRRSRGATGVGGLPSTLYLLGTGVPYKSSHQFWDRVLGANLDPKGK